MGNAFGQMLPSAVAVAVSPLPIVATVLLLVTPRGRVNGPSFILGWLIGLTIIATIVLAIAGGVDATSDDGPSTWVNVLVLVFGILLVLVAVKQFRGRPHAGEEAPTPKWMGALDTFTPIKAIGAGVVLSAVNPKNFLLTVAAEASIAATGISTGQQIAVSAAFILIATIGVATPAVIFFAMGERSQELLTRLKNWLTANNAIIMGVILLIIGVKLIGEAISGFSN
jgi:threonine/homoserine/homoserine lactone efflux protein